MSSEPADSGHELFGAWCAPIFSVLTVVGFLGFAGFYAPAPAWLPPARLAGQYAEHRFGIELGLSIFCVATAFLAIFTVALSLALARIEGRAPIMAVSQLLGGLGVVLLIFISCCLWIGAAYRAGDAAPDVTVALNDAAWFGFLVGWVMLSLQMAVTAAVTLRERSVTPLVPRWLAWASVVGAVVLVTANGCVFTRTGAFAWDGVLGYYLPMAIWATWLDGHAWYLRKRLRRRHTEPAAALAQV
ncbi:MAG TPA: hypothetical protein VH141_07755 [Pseudonocardia sp.]|nr:hypothetical protein [Pseudonocardia sp.]